MHNFFKGPEIAFFFIYFREGVLRHFILLVENLWKRATLVFHSFKFLQGGFFTNFSLPNA